MKTREYVIEVKTGTGTKFLQLYPMELKGPARATHFQTKSQAEEFKKLTGLPGLRVRSAMHLDHRIRRRRNVTQDIEEARQTRRRRRLRGGRHTTV